MKSTKSFMPLIRFAAGSVLLVTTTLVSVPSFATSCDKGPNMSGIREKNGVLWVKGKYGQSASTTDMGMTWSIDKEPTPDSAVFWNKMFESKDSMYQNMSLGYGRPVYVITKKKDAELWEVSPDNLILFSRGDQLFSFKGKLYKSDTSVRLIHGEIFANANSHMQSDIHVEVSSSYLCKLTAESGECLNPYRWNTFEEKLTGFFAREDGSFFLSTSDRLLFFDVKADKWSRISSPAKWDRQCSS